MTVNQVKICCIKYAMQIFRNVNNNKYCATFLTKLGIKCLFIFKMSFFQTKMYKQIIKVISVEWKLPTMGHFGTLIEQHFARFQKHLGSVLFVVNDGQRPFLIHFLIYLQKKPRLFTHWGQIVFGGAFLYHTCSIKVTNQIKKSDLQGLYIKVSGIFFCMGPSIKKDIVKLQFIMFQNIFRAFLYIFQDI